ncbi:MAG TPA: YjjG family noncanonical pyrimidine nucleotidase [Cyclobacteriaceae bacterium]|nr:YjjG family noncanonical pyrimidine nucleotidase [Cyclobacteriaceae bacterium]
MTNTKKYKCVFFDLDHTLWDYETNSEESLKELYAKYGLDQRGCCPFGEFYKGFVKVNTEIWDSYDRGLIPKDVIRQERFHRVFLHAGLDDYQMSLQFSAEYIEESPKKSNLVAHAKDILDYLYPRYPLYIITNGFEEIQGTKMASSGITDYFKGVVTSARAGHKKPEKEIFEFALRENGFACSDSIMIGDNLLTDIAGAGNASVDTVYYNPYRFQHQEPVTYEIASLKELLQIL